jgi:hypothetical protein
MRLAALLVVCALALPAAALAHGDAASHYLETESLYPSFANRPSQAAELRLLGLLQASERAGYPIKVALVGATDDVPEQPGMLRAPQRYADYVGGVLTRWRGPLLVVTPHGFGVTGARRAQLGRGPAAADGDALAAAAMHAVRRIARAGGHPLPAQVAPAAVLVSSSDDGGAGGLGRAWLSLGLFVAVLAAALLSRPFRRRRSRS